MGEAIYKIKLTFKTPADAKEGKKKLTDFLVETEKAYWFWQESRGGSKEAKVFWTAFKIDFPNTYDFLKSFGMADHPQFGSALAGQMSLVGQEGDAGGVKIKGNDVTYASEVWHMATWTPFAAYVVAKFDPVKVELGGGAGS